MAFVTRLLFLSMSFGKCFSPVPGFCKNLFSENGKIDVKFL